VTIVGIFMPNAGDSTGHFISKFLLRLTLHFNIKGEREAMLMKRRKMKGSRRETRYILSWFGFKVRGRKVTEHC